jgi:DNA-binding MarR family transcriptional regulator
MVNRLHNVSRADDALERLFRVTTVLADAMAEDLAARGLSRARATVVAVLHRMGPSNQRALADVLRVTPRNVTGLVDGLEEAGLVVRSRHPQDRRASLVSLTDAGVELAVSLAADERRLAQYLFGELDRDDVVAVTNGLDRVLERLAAPAFDDLRRRARER